jgi:hypothetical protein
MQGSYGIHTYQINGNKFIEEGCFIDGILSGYGKQDIADGR